MDLINQIILFAMHPFALAPLLLGQASVAIGTSALLIHWLGVPTSLVGMHVPWLVMMLVYILVQETVSFHVHYLQHKLRLLWELHKVHHTVEYMLLVLSTRRSHPLNEIVGTAISSLFGGIALAVISYLLGLEVKGVVVDATTAYYFANAVSFHHLRHSHFPLGYGRLERFLMSPVQHHIHHSYETEHWDKNFGWLLSLWDRVYGTIVYSDNVAPFPIGLPPEERGDYDGSMKLMVTPVIRIAGMFRGAFSRPVTAPRPQ